VWWWSYNVDVLIDMDAVRCCGGNARFAARGSCDSVSRLMRVSGLEGSGNIFLTGPKGQRAKTSICAQKGQYISNS
jgi:hypothetical protein